MSQRFSTSHPFVLALTFLLTITSAAPVRSTEFVTPGLNDAWYNPATAGQGAFINVFPELEKVFMSWFTYDVQRPNSVAAQLGDPGHRWLTGFGGWQDNIISLKLTNTSGGVFDSSDHPVTNSEDYGSVLLDIRGCRHADFHYDIPALDLRGVFPIQRVAEDNAVLCEALAREPDQPANTEFYPPDGMLTVCRYDAPVNVTTWACEMKAFSDYGYGPIDQFVIREPYHVFFDAAKRREELQALDRATRDNWCRANALGEDVDFSTYTIEIPPVITEANREVLAPMFITMLYARIQNSYLDNAEAGNAIARVLHHWASKGALLDLDFLDNNQGVRLDLWYSFPVYLLAWESAKTSTALNLEQRATVEAWLDDLADKLGRYDGEDWGDVRLSNMDISNQSYVQALGLMVYGVLRGDDDLFQRGIMKYFAVLDGLVRDDGSFVHESQRGPYALVYSAGSAAQMIRMAELAARQGYNLYEVEVDGRSLMDVIDYTLDALEDPSLLKEYTQYRNPDFCPYSNCEGWDMQDYDYSPGGFNFAEIEVLKRRFPGTPLAARIEALFPASEYQGLGEGPFLQTCEYRDLSP